MVKNVVKGGEEEEEEGEMRKRMKNCFLVKDARLPHSLAGGQGLYLRSLDNLGRSNEAKDHNKKSKV